MTEERFLEVVKQYKPDMLAAAKRILRQYGQEEAEDIVQVAIVYMCTPPAHGKAFGRPRYSYFTEGQKGGFKTSTWLLQMVKQAAIRAIRYAPTNRDPCRPFSDFTMSQTSEGSVARRTVDGDHFVGSDGRDLEVKLDIANALSSLTPYERRIVQEAFIERRPLYQVAGYSRDSLVAWQRAHGGRGFGVGPVREYEEKVIEPLRVKLRGLLSEYGGIGLTPANGSN